MQNEQTKEKVHPASVQRSLQGRATPSRRPLIGPFILQWHSESKSQAKLVKNNLLQKEKQDSRTWWHQCPKLAEEKNEFQKCSKSDEVQVSIQMLLNFSSDDPFLLIIRDGLCNSRAQSLEA